MTPDLERAAKAAHDAYWNNVFVTDSHAAHTKASHEAFLRALENLSPEVVEAMVDAARGNEKKFNTTRTSVVLAAHRAMLRAVLGDET